MIAGAATRPRLDFERQTEAPGEAQHFMQQLRKWLIEWADQNDYDIYADGLVVHTADGSRLALRLPQIARDAGLELRRVVPVGEDLESVFTRLTASARGAGR